MSELWDPLLPSTPARCPASPGMGGPAPDRVPHEPLLRRGASGRQGPRTGGRADGTGPRRRRCRGRGPRPSPRPVRLEAGRRDRSCGSRPTRLSALLSDELEVTGRQVPSSLAGRRRAQIHRSDARPLVAHMIPSGNKRPLSNTGAMRVPSLPVVGMGRPSTFSTMRWQDPPPRQPPRSDRSVAHRPPG